MLPLDDNISAKFFALVDFCHGRHSWHDHSYGHIQLLAMPRESEGVVTCRRGNHTNWSLIFLQQLLDGVPSASLLERASKLAEFALQKNVRACNLAQEGGLYAWRSHDSRPN